MGTPSESSSSDGGVGGSCLRLHVRDVRGEVCGEGWGDVLGGTGGGMITLLGPGRVGDVFGDPLTGELRTFKVFKMNIIFNSETNMQK